MPAAPVLDIPDDTDEDEIRSIKEDYRDERTVWRDEMDNFKIQLAAYKDQQRGLRIIDQAITASVDSALNRVLDRLDTPRERFSLLKERFGRTYIHGVETLWKWREECIKGPSKGQDVLRWLDEWEELREEVVSLEYEDSTHHALLLLKASKYVLPSWWESRFQEMVVNRESIDVQTLIESLRATYQESQLNKKPQNSSSRPAFATSTFQGHKEARPNNQGPPTKSEGFGDRKQCPCGGAHPVLKCWTLNEDERPTEYQVSNRRLEAVRRAYEKEPEWKGLIEPMGSIDSMNSNNRDDVRGLASTVGGASTPDLATDEVLAPLAAEEPAGSQNEGLTYNKGTETHGWTPPPEDDSIPDQGVEDGHEAQDEHGAQLNMDLTPDSPNSLPQEDPVADLDTTDLGADADDQENESQLNRDIESRRIDGLDVDNIVQGQRMMILRR
ncbi:hypothetical protein N7520_010254 [Penicillium odoratum]|uniref:uncharacterized protein n=1 Tax=Penicillium odoratum TaxID=1167516 RepID=UPI0025486648|nr:uncharacterized protein N7520_010254 [Penicillium odoratum]KAJ5745072.1 hypothetical protein N7520_010254 [Penicillium odoratum]